MTMSRCTFLKRELWIIQILFLIRLSVKQQARIVMIFYFIAITLTKLGAVSTLYIVMIITCEGKKIVINQLIKGQFTYSFLSNIWDLWHQRRDHFRMFSTQQLHYRISSTYRMNYDVDRIHNHLDIWSFLGQ